MMLLIPGLWLALVGTTAVAQLPQIPLIPVELTSRAGSLVDVTRVVQTNGDAVDGWAMPPVGEGEAGQAAVFRFESPVSARCLRLNIGFDPNKADGAFYRVFAIHVTNDEHPSLSGKWHPVCPLRLRAAKGKLKQEGDGLRLLGAVSAPDLVLDFAVPFDGVTGLRLSVSETDNAAAAQPAVLTLLRLFHHNMATTNVAVGCPAKTSVPLPERMKPDFITDGKISTYVQPAGEGASKPFGLEIDLKRPRQLDHLRLRLRYDLNQPLRFFDIRVRLIENRPEDGGAEAWELIHHADGSYSDTTTGELNEVIKVPEGTGKNQGRYLQITFLERPGFTPVVAEVEAYEVMTPLGVTARIKNSMFHAGATLEIPSASTWLSFTLTQPKLEDPLNLGRRWRIVGFDQNWAPVPASGQVECRCPPPGEYEFQAQLRHSDNLWNDEIYRVPMIVSLPFWLQTSTRIMGMVLVALLSAALAGWISRRVITRKMAELERRNELATERTRIARDMHDAVGSQLTQLAVLHDIAAHDKTLPEEVRAKLSKLSQTARASVASMDAMVWTINPGNDSLAHTASYLTQVAREYLDPLGIRCRQEMPDIWPEFQLPAQTRHQMYLAFREALQNIIKHARAQEVVVHMHAAERCFFVSISDDGVGLDGTEMGGVEKDGLQNMRARLASVGGFFRLLPSPTGGTTVEMQIPIPL